MRALCFDLDGTLIDSGRTGLQRIIKISKARNLSMSPEIEQKIRGMWGADPFKILRTIWPDEDPKAFFAEWENVDIAEPHPVFPGTREAIHKLSTAFDLSITTNRYPRTIPAQLQHNGLDGYFSLIVTPEMTGHKKPAPESMQPVIDWCKEINIERQDIALIGDTVEGDWKLAQAVDIPFYAVTSGGVDTREKFMEAGVPEDRIFDSVADLAPTLWQFFMEKLLLK